MAVIAISEYGKNNKVPLELVQTLEKEDPMSFVDEDKAHRPGDPVPSSARTTISVLSLSRP